MRDAGESETVREREWEWESRCRRRCQLGFRISDRRCDARLGKMMIASVGRAFGNSCASRVTHASRTVALSCSCLVVLLLRVLGLSRYCSSPLIPLCNRPRLPRPAPSASTHTVRLNPYRPPQPFPSAARLAPPRPAPSLSPFTWPASSTTERARPPQPLQLVPPNPQPPTSSKTIACSRGSRSST